MKLTHGVTIGSMLEATATKYPDRPAVYENGGTISYSDLLYAVDRFAMGLLSVGIRRGTRVGIWAKDCTRTLVSFLAVERIGAVAVMLNTKWNHKELRVQDRDVNINYMIFDDSFTDYDFLSINKYIYIGRKEFVGTHSFHDILNCAGDQVEAVFNYATSVVKDDDEDMILFTSGSTGEPHGVMTTHFSRTNMSVAQAEMVRATQYDVFCVCIPSFHCFGMCGNILAAITVGACLAFPESQKTAHILECVEKAKCTVLTAVPTLFSSIIANKEFDRYDLSSLRVGLVGGSMCSAEFFREVQSKIGFNLLPSLGQTEATSGVTCSRYEEDDALKAGTVGYVIDELEYKIVDIKTGKQLSAEHIGELCIRGYNVMKGYCNRPDATKEAIDIDGFLHTGDMGYFFDDGRICITGRLKELIIRAGENIAPTEIENVIYELDGVRRCKIIGLPDDHYGEIICACIEPESDAHITDEDIKRCVASNLAAYKIPSVVRFFDRLPLTSSGKISTVKLLEEVENKCSTQN